MKSELTQMVSESAVHNNGQFYSYISIKSPWYDLSRKITGIFGCSIPIEIVNFSNYFSYREIEVLYHLIRGKTLKAIATLLNISPRTVEQHLENIKIELNASSKADVIEKTIDIFYAENK